MKYKQMIHEQTAGVHVSADKIDIFDSLQEKTFIVIEINGQK